MGTAIFLKQTLNVAAKDSDLIYQERLQKHSIDVEVIKAIFNEGDQDQGGDMDRREFRRLFRNEEVVRWLSQLGLEVSEVQGLFNLLDDGDGKITFDELLSGIFRLRGEARAVDLATLLFENKKIHSKLADIKRELQLQSKELLVDLVDFAVTQSVADENE